MAQLAPVAVAALSFREPLALRAAAHHPRRRSADSRRATCATPLQRRPAPTALTARRARRSPADGPVRLRTLTASGDHSVCVVTEHWDAFDGADGGF